MKLIKLYQSTILLENCIVLEAPRASSQWNLLLKLTKLFYYKPNSGFYDIQFFRKNSHLRIVNF